MAITLVRIDDRLIHGQVALSWTKMLNASVIVVPDDEAAADSMQKVALKAATPIGVRSAVVSIADAATLLNGPKIKNDRVFIVARSPASVVRLIKAGVALKKVIIGNMRMEDGKKRITKIIAAGQAEWDAFTELDAMGIDLVEQWLPGEESKNFNAILKKTNFSSL